MRLGKLDNDTLEKLVLNKFTASRSEVMRASGVGDDCAMVDLQGQYAVLSMDPITSASTHLGRLSVHINCNDAAAAGAEPVGLLVTLLAPPNTEPEDISAVADELARTAEEVGVNVLGGHTEVTDSVTRMITITAVLAKTGSPLSGAKPGNDIVMTKWAGMEGTAVIASDFADRYGFSQKYRQEAQKIAEQLSVVKEGLFAARNGATAMHDVTEGGVFGALWELARANGVGISVDESKIPLLPVTKEICEKLRLDAMRLLGSGSMLIACENGKEMQENLEKSGIPATVIGKVEAGSGVRLNNGVLLEAPQADELYRLF